VIGMRLGEADLLRCRFATSPLWETISAVRVILYPAEHALHLPWLRTLAARGGRLELGVLPHLLPPAGYAPDFLCPPPTGPLPDIDHELGQLYQVPPEVFVAEITRLASGTPMPAHLRDLTDDPLAGRTTVAAAVESCWNQLLAADWPRLQDLLDADITYRARRITAGGMQALFADLHPHVTWDHGVNITTRTNRQANLDGRGLLLIPSVFAWPEPTVQLDPPWQPTLIYPGRGVGHLWEPPAAQPGALAKLLGRRRGAILMELAEPATTSALARRLSISPPTASGHLKTLQRAGLLTAHRAGHRVHYQRTELGHALAVAGQPAPGRRRQN
jgi:DNA-binding transcriptional ArsR family regulator